MFIDIGKNLWKFVSSQIDIFSFNKNKSENNEQIKLEEFKDKTGTEQMSLFEEQECVFPEPKENFEVRFSILERFAMYSREDVHNVFSPETNFQAGCGIWGLHGIIRIPNTKDYIFYVTYGVKRGEHKFEEGIDKNGVVSWQSQPRQNFKSPDIINFINHDERKNNIYLFKRNSRQEPKYMYLGKLKYIEHDINKENPVWFKWQIIDWENKDYTIDNVTNISNVEYNLTQFDNIFSVEDIKREYNKITTEKINEIITKETKNGLLYCGKKEYLYWDKLNIDGEVIEALREFINNNMKSINKNYLSYKVLYANISLIDEKLFRELKVENRPELLYSIIKFKFKEYIFKDELFGEGEFPSIHEILYEKLKNKNIITFQLVNEEYNELLLSNISKEEYNRFIEEILENYYVLNEDNTIILKDEFIINEENYVDIKIILNAFFEKNEKLDLKVFKGYILFPKVKYDWNNYLLKAVVDKYFKDTYEINDEVIIKKEGVN